MNQSLLLSELVVHTLARTSEYNFQHYAMPAIERRLASFIEKSDFKDIAALLIGLTKQDKDLIDTVAQALTVTHTHFFRDHEYFELLNDVLLPEINMFSQIKVWSVACSSGQEVYSIASLLKHGGYLTKSAILGSDINKVALDTARAATYELELLSEFQDGFMAIEGLQPASLLPYVIPKENTFSFAEDIRQACHFANHNMVTNSSLGHFHLILCRNVLIYLSPNEQKNIIQKLLVNSLEPGGYLVLGEAENLLDFAEQLHLKKLRPKVNIYQFLPE